MIGRIYLITNIVNGKKYVGQTTKSIEERFNKHVKSALNNRKTAICHAIRKYGKKSFFIECIQDNIDINDLDLAEQYWINYYNTFKGVGYNSTSGGNQCKISDETKLKISNSLRGVPKSEKAKKNMSEAQKGKVGELNSFYGKKHSQGTIQQIKETLKGQMDGENNPFYGKTHSEETRKLLSQNHIGLQAGEKHPRAKLTEEDVIEIRELAKNSDNKKQLARDLSKQYNVGKNAIEKIIYRRTWRHI